MHANDEKFEELLKLLFQDTTSNESTIPLLQPRNAGAQEEKNVQDIGMDVLDDAMQPSFSMETDKYVASSPDCPEAVGMTSIQTEQPRNSENEDIVDLCSQEEQPVSTSTVEKSKAGRDVTVEVKYMKECLGRYEKKVQENGSNGKIQVHQVVLFILLSTEQHSEMKYMLDNILVFCDANGKPINRRSDYFLAKDTKTMGLIWKQVKDNKRDSFDTFARAMRVGREKERKYFDYLEKKGSKKRVYRLGSKCLEDFKKMESLLPEIC